MNSDKLPFSKTLIVCTHSRAEGRVACGNPGRGGLELCEALKEGVKKSGLKGKVRVARSGCLDLCEKGPNAFFYPDGQWFSGLKPSDADLLLKKLES